VKKILLATTLFAATILPAKATDLEGLIGGAAYLTLYAANCGTLPAKTKDAVQKIILELPDEVMLKALKYDRKREEIGNGIFCAMMRKSFADVLG
jgi:hypothetical protein